jgi:hypothetical protein
MLYSYVVSNYWGVIFIHYKLLIVFAPILFTAIYLNYFEYKKIQETILALLIFALSITSIISNSTISYNYLNSKYGVERLATTEDIKISLKTLPDNTELCLWGNFDDLKTSFEYIAKHVISPPKPVVVVKDCYQGQTAIHFKFKRLDDLKLSPNPFTNKYTQIQFENEALILFQV